MVRFPYAFGISWMPSPLWQRSALDVVADFLQARRGGGVAMIGAGLFFGGSGSYVPIGATLGYGLYRAGSSGWGGLWNDGLSQGLLNPTGRGIGPGGMASPFGMTGGGSAQGAGGAADAASTAGVSAEVAALRKEVADLRAKLAAGEEKAEPAAAPQTPTVQPPTGPDAAAPGPADSTQVAWGNAMKKVFGEKKPPPIDPATRTVTLRFPDTTPRGPAKQFIKAVLKRYARVAKSLPDAVAGTKFVVGQSGTVFTGPKPTDLDAMLKALFPPPTPPSPAPAAVPQPAPATPAPTPAPSAAAPVPELGPVAGREVAPASATTTPTALAAEAESRSPSASIAESRPVVAPVAATSTGLDERDPLKLREWVKEMADRLGAVHRQPPVGRMSRRPRR